MNKHIPTRKCVVCREIKEKHNLIRMYKLDNRLIIDNGDKAGKGIYICRNIECIEKAQRKNILAKVSRGKVDASVYEILKTK